MSEKMLSERMGSYWSILESTECLLQGRSFSETTVPDLSAAADSLQQDTGASRAIGEMDLEELSEAIGSCQRCGLCRTRDHAVPGKGVLNPRIMLIGEAPGAQEDATGLPFVGRSGSYLDRWMHAIGFSRERDLFIGNIIKCRPPENRDPTAAEQEACMPYLIRQLELIRPEMILCLGRVASQMLLETTESLSRMRGNVYEYAGIPVMVTYHPSAVLRYPDKFRRPVWEDLKNVRAFIEKRGTDS